jgi:hypothetical protein
LTYQHDHLLIDLFLIFFCAFQVVLAFRRLSMGVHTISPLILALMLPAEPIAGRSGADRAPARQQFLRRRVTVSHTDTGHLQVLGGQFVWIARRIGRMGTPIHDGNYDSAARQSRPASD